MIRKIIFGYFYLITKRFSIATEHASYNLVEPDAFTSSTSAINFSKSLLNSHLTFTSEEKHIN